MKTRAAIVRGPGQPWEVTELELDEPKEHEALVRVVGALHELKAAGAEIAYLHIFDIDDLDHLRLIGAEVIPQLA